MAQGNEIETRTVINRLKHPDGSIEEITVTERRPKRRHDSMMRHMQNLAAVKRKREEAAAAVTDPAAAPDTAPDTDVAAAAE